MDEPQTSYKWCIVPKCKITSIKNPEKAFINVPKDEKIRKRWMNAIRRDPKDISVKTVCFVCEDHFDLENDLENYMKWKLVGGKKMLKKGVTPHKFDCQIDRKVAFTHIPRQSGIKRARMELIQAAEESYSTVDVDTEERQDEIQPVLEEFTSKASTCSTNSRELGVQTNIRPHYRSKASQCEFFKAQLADSACSPIFSKIHCDVGISPMKISSKTFKKKLDFALQESQVISDVDVESESSSSPAESLYELSSALESSDTGSEGEYESDFKKMEMAKLAVKHTTYIIEKNPRRYLGVTKECEFLIELLQKHTSLNRINIYLTLKKIRLAQTFAELADDFGISESVASRMFHTSVLIISNVLRDMIIWPSADLIKRNLPIAFRARFGKVQAVIDCFEIEIQKPSDAIKQALTWSEYKKANTLKYLISSTPDGIINFVSTGYGGRTSDTVIVETCGFLEKVVAGTEIMADRGFKHIDMLVESKGGKLVRPPSVEAGTKMSEAQVLETKRIASLRIHIERVIRRIREFKILKPHSCIDHKLIPYTDAIIFIVCGIINTQPPLIKKV